MTQKKDFRKGATRRAPNRRGIPGWIWAALGLALGLGAAGVYTRIKNRPPPEPAASKVKAREPLSVSDIPEPEPGPAGPYTYQDQLKKNRVEIPEKGQEPHHDARPLPELRPGTYMLQAGAYRTEAEADKQRARLAMIGVESKIEAGSANDQSVYRVRIGPFHSLDQLNHTRARLHSAEIDVTQSRIAD